jgi:4-hydroxy-tetrahydrodipicolinate synthase
VGQETSFVEINFDGVMAANVTPFTQDGRAVDHDALAGLGIWLSTVPGITGVVCNGHAGEGTALSDAERAEVVTTLVEAVEGRVPVIAGIISEGTGLAAAEARRAADAGAAATLVYPPHGWLRFGYQPPAPVDRYRAIAEESGLPQVLFQYPHATLASYSLETLLEICELGTVVAIKNGVRNMSRWDDELPVLRENFPSIKIVTCQDEFLLHTMWEADGSLIGYASLVPELMVELQAAASARDYPRAKALYDASAPLTKVVYHRQSHMEGTIALKMGLAARGILPHATVRPPLFPLGAEDDKAIRAALEFVGVETVA